MEKSIEMNLKNLKKPVALCISLFFIASMFAVSTARADSGATINFSSGFEDGFNSWTSTYGGVSVISSPIYSGSYAMKCSDPWESLAAKTIGQQKETYTSAMFLFDKSVAGEQSLIGYRNWAGNPTASMGISVQQGRVFIFVQTILPSYSYSQYELTRFFTPGTWYKLALDVSSTSAAIYVNDKQVSSVLLANIPATDSVNVGMFWGNGAYTGNLYIDNVQINTLPPTLPTQLAQSKIIAAAHWTVNTPVPGGWIFATLAREPGQFNNAYLYVSGYHPSGVTGPSNMTFTGTNSSVELKEYGNVLSVTAAVNFTFISGGVTVAGIHNVNVNWTLPTAAEGTWSDTNADVNINIFGSTPHSDLSTSDWATIGILSPQQTIATAHWIVDSPQPGGWVFAAAGKDDGGKNAWLCVAGYHPAGSVGPYAAIFEALNTTGVQLTTTANSISISTITLNFTVATYTTSKPTITYVLHDVSVNWALTTQPQDSWNPAGANISINIHGSTGHSVVSTSSWAIADLESS